jgi:hypothetical protein
MESIRMVWIGHSCGLRNGVMYMSAPLHGSSEHERKQILSTVLLIVSSLMVSDVLMHWVMGQNPENNNAFDFEPRA